MSEVDIPKLGEDHVVMYAYTIHNYTVIHMHMDLH